MSAADRAVIQISRPLHDRLTMIKNDQQQRLGRQVSFSEVIEQLLDDGWAPAAWRKTEQVGETA